MSCTVNVLRLLLTTPWVSPQSVIVVFPDHTHFLSLFLNNLYVCPFAVTKIVAKNHRLKNDFFTNHFYGDYTH